MEQVLDTYPVFEVNQVLTRKHLNDVFGYLDQQTRLTRSRLIGIGIVCGLEISLDGNTIVLSKGCGVSSEGYLIVEPEDVALVSYRTYTMPAQLDYPTFKDAADNQYPLWELFPAGEPNTTPLNDPATFLDDKGVVLFLELNKQALRNCSPNNCDDKGAEVTVSVRRLLVRRQDLDSLLAQAHDLGGELTADELDAALSVKLQLPDLKVPRFDVPNTSPVSSAQVYAAFLEVFAGSNLVAATASALTAAYDAFEPIVGKAYPSNPFAGFSAAYGFLDSAPTNTAQVRFLQYYVELFEDLIRAYDEFRWKGFDLVCACCPPDALFPRHLMLGLVHPELVSNPAKYRHGFLHSPAVSACTEESKALIQLFRRLVELAARFSNSPTLPPANEDSNIDPQIRVTPSVLGDVRLEQKAIPYYYQHNGTPPLYRLWSLEKTKRGRAHQNLGYRYDEYSPSPPAFVSAPLKFDLEAYDFLRIEGHLGKPYQKVLASLLSLKESYRLAFDVVALRTGPYDDSLSVEADSQSAHFQDLEALYDALREELLASLAAGAMDLYGVPIADSKEPGGTPTLELLKQYAPHYRYPEGSVGSFYEANMERFSSTPYIDIDQTLMSSPSLAGEVLKVYCALFTGVSGLPPENFAHVVSIFYFSKLAEILPQRLDALGYADFENKYQDLLTLVRYFRSAAAQNVPADLASYAPQAQLIDQFSHVLYSCKIEAVRSAHDEFKHRIVELKKMQFLASFLQKHPGLQHKGGVPTNGTFILVYHVKSSKPPAPKSEAGFDSKATFKLAAAAGPDLGAAPRNQELARRMQEAIDRIAKKPGLAKDPDIDFLIGSLTGRSPEAFDDLTSGLLPENAVKVIKAAVTQLDEGAVIADFFLPYRLSGVPGIEFVLPKETLLLQAKVAGATGPDRFAPVALQVKGGTGPYELSIDGGPYEPLSATVMLLAGSHVLEARDVDGTQSNQQTVAVPEPITFGSATFECAAGKFTAQLPVTGGTPPYQVNGATITGNVYTTPATASGDKVTVNVVDSTGATASTTLEHTCPEPCDLPCEGVAVRRGHRFWLPEADSKGYAELTVGDLVFRVESAPGKWLDLSAAVRDIVKALKLDAVTPAGIDAMLKRINEVLRKELGSPDSFTLKYQSLGPHRLGVLWIEYFECLDFEISVSSSFDRGNEKEALKATYVPARTTILVGEEELVIPAFDGARIDKCQPGAPEKAICSDPPKTELTIQSDVNDRQGTFSVKATPPSEVVSFFWEVQGAEPPVGTGEKFVTQLPKTILGPILVVVTGYTKQGCSVSESTLVRR